MSISRQLLVSKILEETRKVERPEKIRIRAFRAADDVEASIKFHKGHSDVLGAYGITGLNTLNPVWIEDDLVYVILVESLDGRHVYGGARIQISSANNELPIEASVGYMDEKIYNIVKEQRENGGVAEICGLWNSPIVAGMGIGSTFSIRSAFAYASKLPITSMFALCSPYTYRMAGNFGFTKIKEMGNDGLFPYPDEKNTAIVTFQGNISEMTNASDVEKTFIYNLRMNPTQTIAEDVGKSTPIEVHYNL